MSPLLSPMRLRSHADLSLRSQTKTMGDLQSMQCATDLEQRRSAKRCEYFGGSNEFFVVANRANREMGKCMCCWNRVGVLKLLDGSPIVCCGACFVLHVCETRSDYTLEEFRLLRHRKTDPARHLWLPFYQKGGPSEGKE